MRTKNKRLQKHPTVFLSHCLIRMLVAFLLVGFWALPSAAETLDFSNCLNCHMQGVHNTVDHTSAPPSANQMIFAHEGHDNEVSDYQVFVDCSTCHTADLKDIHAYDCATCHPTAFNKLRDCATGMPNWQGGCQQGGCHSIFHGDVATAHSPFSDSSDDSNDCFRCHNADWSVTQDNCHNCHATYGPSHTSPPVTTSDARSYYIGPAYINFSIRDNDGKVVLGRTFYKLDNGPATAAGKLLVVSELGSHLLEFWSVDQSRRVETTVHSTSFTITDDITPPTTTSNALPSYFQGGTITLTAVDNNPDGVKNTYYSFNGGTTHTSTPADGQHTYITLPQAPGVVTYTMVYWSVDWAGNVESQKSVTFTVSSGNGTIRLVWYNSDTTGSPCPYDPAAEASWIIQREDSSTSQIVYFTAKTGSASCSTNPNWSGINDIVVPISTFRYNIEVTWYDSYWEEDVIETFQNIYVNTPGQVVVIHY